MAICMWMLSVCIVEIGASIEEMLDDAKMRKARAFSL
jgi:hypothetical protein